MSLSLDSSELACAAAQSVFLAGERGPVWRVVQGIVRLDRACGPLRQPVQLALPGDLIGVEALCGQAYQFSASALTRVRLEPLRSADGAEAPAAWMQQALLQHLRRSQDMTQLRTGSVVQRLAHLLHLMGLELPALDRAQPGDADAIRQALPALREIALVIDAKTETVCRALAQLLPPRRKKSPPRFSAHPAVTPVRSAVGWALNASPMGVAA